MERATGRVWDRATAAVHTRAQALAPADAMAAEDMTGGKGDRQLMRAESQVSEAIQKYGDTVYRVCFLYLRSKSDAEDVFQEVFLKYLLFERPFQSDEHEKAWLLRVSMNACKDLHKSFFRKRTVPLEETQEVAVPAPEYSGVYDAVRALPDQYKSVIYLHYYEGYTVPQMSALLKKKENTLYTWLARGRELLKERLGGEAFDESNERSL